MPWLCLATPMPEKDPEKPLSWAEARKLPCLGCSAECCTILPLQDFQVNSLSDVDWCFYLLNFEGTELKAIDNGSGTESWQICVQINCRKLDGKGRCSVHNSDEQPDICKRFNPFDCSYRRIYQHGDSLTSLRVDRVRLSAYAQLLQFNDAREIVARPSFAQLFEVISALPIPEKSPTKADEPWDNRERWEAEVRAGHPGPEPVHHRFGELQNPCGSCAAWCCTRLFFPLATPIKKQNLDYLYFLMGFPGVEVGISADGSYSIIVKSRCRHLQRAADGSGRCGIYGQPERPQLCTYYDATGCAYKEHFGGARPRNMLRLRYENFGVLSGLYTFNPEGYITGSPSLPELYAALEAGWGEASG